MTRTKTAFAIRHIAFEDLGKFAQPLIDGGYSIQYVDAERVAELRAEALEADFVAVLGGPIGVYEEKEYSFLSDEIDIIGARLAQDRPTLGICLGAQLMARALGADVYPGSAGKEIGWHKVSLTADGMSGPLRHLHGVDILHWHGDTFSLPASARLLGSTEKYANQAFSYGRHGLGIQFHPEVDVSCFERWLIGHACEISASGIATPSSLRDAALRHGRAAGEAGERCFREWLKGVEQPT